MTDVIITITIVFTISVMVLYLLDHFLERSNHSFRALSVLLAWLLIDCREKPQPWV